MHFLRCTLKCGYFFFFYFEAFCLNSSFTMHNIENSPLHQFAEQFPLQYLEGQRGCRLAYRHCVHQPVADKLVILVNGRVENILKWTEIAQDF